MSIAIDTVLREPWAITRERLEIICGIADRTAQESPEALEARLGRPLGNTKKATVLDGVATIPIEGPLFTKANLLTAHSGASSYEVIASDLIEAVDNPSVQAIILDIDSPGGQVTGASELAQLVKSAREVKPVYAFASGMVASAAYWIASAAKEIWATDTSSVGSIGVVAAMRTQEAKKGETTYRFVSSQSPNKGAGPETEQGAESIQRNIDQIAEVFIGAVSENRSTPRSDILSKFGQGDVFVGAQALARGMVDGITTLEALRARIVTENHEMKWDELTIEGLAENRPDVIEEIKAATAEETLAGERQRVEEITALTSGLGLDDEFISKLIRQGATATEVKDFAFEVLADRARIDAQADASKKNDFTAQLEDAEAELDVPSPGGPVESGGNEALERILAAGTKIGVIKQ